MNVKQGFTFDDLLLVPKYSTIKSRSSEYIDTSVSLGKGVKLSIPIISANMKNVTGYDMANTIMELGGLPILHRFCTIEENIAEFIKISKERNSTQVACSVGVHGEGIERVDKLVNAGCHILCVDVAHGDHVLVLDIVDYIAKTYPKVLLIAGNIATANGARRLYEAGADVVKCGIGPGSLCSTRIETGNGVGQMTALHDVFTESATTKQNREIRSLYTDLPSLYSPNYVFDIKNRKFKIIADGGLRTSGDCVKALVYSDAVMLGSMLAGTDEAPGNTVRVNGVPHKEYEGSSTHKTRHVEGVKALVPCKGSAKDIIERTMEGIRSGLSYQGCENLNELKEDPEFIQVTNAGLIESHPHDVVIR